MTDMPVPLRFRLPAERWESVDPASLGVVNAHYLAVRRATAGGYTPTISVSGDRRQDGASLEAVADESLVALGREARDVRLQQRRTVGSEAAPGISQLLAATITVEEEDVEVRQAQVLLDIRDVQEPARRAVVVLSMTCRAGQLDALVPEFQEFVASVRPVSAASA